MFDPWKKSPSNTLHTALSKKKPIPPLSFWRERHCSASERLEKEEPGRRRQPWWLADRFAAQNCSRVHGQTLLYFKFSNVKMTTRVRVDFMEGVFFFFLFFSLVFVITPQCSRMRAGAQCRLLASRGWTKLWKEPVGHHNASMTSSFSSSPFSASSASFFTVSEITSPVTFTGIVEIQEGWYVNWLSEGAEAKKWPANQQEENVPIYALLLEPSGETSRASLQKL